jgi:S1-C subfamily serine protease
MSPDHNGNLWYTDPSSITKDGKTAYAWVKVVNKTREWLASSSRYYSYTVSRVSFDCDQQSYAFQTTLYYAEDDNVIYTETPNNANMLAGATPPGTIGNALLSLACGSRSQPSAPTAQLSIGPASTGVSWTLDGSDADVNIYSTDYKISVGNGKVFYFSKMEYKTPQAVGNGQFYDNIYSIMEIDCDSLTYTMTAADVYDSSGAIVHTYSTQETPKPQAIGRGSAADVERARYCGSVGATGSNSKPSELSSGTAWIGPKGYVVTAAHVVEGATRIALAQDGKFVGTAELVESDPTNDVAILKPVFSDGSHPALSFSDDPPRLGERLFTLGYPVPDQLGLSLKMTSGEVSALTGVDVSTGRPDDVRLLQVSVPIQSGNSGGPVFDDSGRVVGIIESKFQLTSNNEITQNVNYALKIAYVRALIDGLPTLGGYSVAPANSSRSEAIDSARRGVFLLVASGSGKP